MVDNLWHLEGQTVQVLEDGGRATDKVVSNGSINLDAQSSIAFVGLLYRGTLELLNIDVGGVLGPAEAKPRNVIKVAVRFLNSLGCQFGTSYYTLERWLFRHTPDKTSRPVPPFSGIKEQTYSDRWGQDGKSLVILQEK